jgi:hypothetical protein
MTVASEAQAAYFAGDVEAYRHLTQDAFAKEKSAAQYLENKREAEPTRSILYRGAAQLAYNCGEYQEAERLIAQALLGNPPEEMRQSLRELSRQVLDAVEVLQSVENAQSPDYLQQLRAQALHIWVQPKKLTHLTAVYLDNVVEVLRRLKDSFLNYVEIDFGKNFASEDYKEPEKLLASLRNEANPLLVGLKFSSFAASISSDLVVMAKQYSPEINAWKRDVFLRYKSEVFEAANYESEQAAEQLADPYTPQERRRIFQPVVELFKESNEYSVALTDAHFREKKKVYKPVTKRVRNILVPTLSAAEEHKARSLYQIWGMGDAESGKGKLEEIARQEMESASFTRILTHIRFEKEEIYLAEEIELAIQYDKPMFSLRFAPLQIALTDNSYAELVKSFQKRFIEVFNDLRSRPDSDLAFDEASMKEYLQRAVFSKAQ